jgi:hypothetical protein
MARNAMRFNEQGSVLYDMGDRILRLCSQTMSRSPSSELPIEATTLP